MLPVHIRRLVDALAAARGSSPSTIGRLAYGSGDFYARLRAGCDITSRRATRVLQWLSDHWPADLPWPSDIPRPTPAPSSPVSPSVIQPAESQTADPVTAARAAWDRIVDAPDPASREAAMREALAIGMRLDPATGRIASPAALCAALGFPRFVYDDVVRRYAGSAGKHPRPGSRPARMLAALQRAGDRRFIQEAA